MASVKSFHLILTLFSCLILICQSMVIPKEPKVLANSPVQNCDDVLQLYKKVGYPVTDCMYVVRQHPYMYYRIDTKLNYQEANLACQTASNSQLASVPSYLDMQMQLNDLYKAKFLLNTWMWLGITRSANGTLVWTDGTGAPPASRWFPYPDSTTNGDCAVMLMLTDSKGEKDISGAFYYSEDCNNKYIAACLAIA